MPHGQKGDPDSMADTTDLLLKQTAQGDFIRLRTFITLRWVAIIGQIAALSFSVLYFDLKLELGLCFLAIGASIIVNLVLMTVYPETKRLTDVEAAQLLLFDISQLAFLVFLTGGLNNPFALLILAPITIAASVLNLRETIIIGFVAIVLITLITYFHVPLRTEQGAVLRLPPIFVFGFWLAIVIGAVFLGFYARRVTNEIRSMSRALLATQMALAREQKLTDLGGVVAAAAHELGTPLATIKLASSELIEDLEGHENLKDDAILIRDQADRCRDILRSMGQAGNDDLHMKYAPISAVLEEAAEPHMDRGKQLTINLKPATNTSGQEPELRRAPEIIHGLRTLIQNAVDFSASNVWIEARWSDDTISVKITDDGEGFPPHLLGRIGDPFMRHRKPPTETVQRPEYEGMGLGLFIAKTLLERSGAELNFANCSDPFLSAEERPEKCGAVVVVSWPRNRITVSEKDRRHALGRNKPVQV